MIVRTGQPLTLLAVRDELTDRPWEGPGQYWPEYPGILAGRDLKAGGTWLAVDSAARCVAAVLNGRGTPAPEATRISRGGLPLTAAATGTMPDVETSRYDPFHLLIADLSQATLYSWDGERLSRQDLPPGITKIVNDGIVPVDPVFETSADWLAQTRVEPRDDPAALIVRHEMPDGRVYASLAAMMITMDEGGMSYDFAELDRLQA
ncbi:NRDE family protein [Nonomuraea sediminis]|uniref:NRDE family protein n=1 Tax=Nonomuraea sediminis TaxID=2835864 RepID=UPI0027DF7B4D|nr:NRDE family protein [Nonomuraea sediminis]